MKFESGEEIVKEYINSFLIKRCEYQWLWERETCGEEKIKNATVPMSEKNKNIGEVFISWFFYLKP